MVEERAEEVRTEEPLVHRRETDRKTDDLIDRYRQTDRHTGHGGGEGG